MGKPLTGKTSLSIDKAPIKRKGTERQKLGILTKEKTKMRSYKFRLETIEALENLRKNVNKKANMELSATNIIEILIHNAVKQGADQVLRQIRNK